MFILLYYYSTSFPKRYLTRIYTTCSNQRYVLRCCNPKKLCDVFSNLATLSCFWVQSHKLSYSNITKFLTNIFNAIGNYHAQLSIKILKLSGFLGMMREATSISTIVSKFLERFFTFLRIKYMKNNI